jgi:hypothetical protein
MEDTGDKTSSRRRRWDLIAAKGKTHYVVTRGIFGYGITMTILTFTWEHFKGQALGLGQISLDLLFRLPLCLAGGYIFGLLTWKWFCLRYGPNPDDLKG